MHISVYPRSVEDCTECAQTDRQTKVKTVYPPVSPHPLGRCKNTDVRIVTFMGNLGCHTKFHVNFM